MARNQHTVEKGRKSAETRNKRVSGRIRKKTRGRQKDFKFSRWDLSLAQKRVSAGLDSESIEAVQDSMGLSNADFAKVIMISPRTLARRRGEDRLPPEESERVYRIGRLFQLATEILGNEQEANDWLREPNFALNHQIPFDLIPTEPGAELVERVLHQIEYGITV